jgi:segregation and condensation protein B
MVQPVGRGGPPGYAVLYGTTGRFLERFGLMSIDELPPLEDFAPDEEMVEKIKRSLSWEIIDEVAVERRSAPTGETVTAPGAEEAGDGEGVGERGTPGAGEDSETAGERGGGFEARRGGADPFGSGEEER